MLELDLESVDLIWTIRSWAFALDWMVVFFNHRLLGLIMNNFLCKLDGLTHARGACWSNKNLKKTFWRFENLMNMKLDNKILKLDVKELEELDLLLWSWKATRSSRFLKASSFLSLLLSEFSESLESWTKTPHLIYRGGWADVKRFR